MLHSFENRAISSFLVVAFGISIFMTYLLVFSPVQTDGAVKGENTQNTIVDNELELIAGIFQDVMVFERYIDEMDNFIFKGQAEYVGIIESKDRRCALCGIDGLLELLRTKNPDYTIDFELENSVGSVKIILEEHNEKKTVQKLAEKVNNLKLRSSGVDKDAGRILPLEKKLLYKNLINEQTEAPEEYKTQGELTYDLFMVRIASLRYSQWKFKMLMDYITAMGPFLDETGYCGAKPESCSKIKDDINTITVTYGGVVSDTLATTIPMLEGAIQQYEQIPPRTVPTSGLEGDLNTDGVVDIFDLVIVGRNFGKKAQ